MSDEEDLEDFEPDQDDFEKDDDEKETEEWEDYRKEGEELAEDVSAGAGGSPRAGGCHGAAEGRLAPARLPPAVGAHAPHGVRDEGRAFFAL